MARVKIISPLGWDFDRPCVLPVKVSSRGLVGGDRADFLKTASHAFLSEVDKLQPKDGEELVHVISHGATENWGANRNGDGFKKKACRDYAHTFEKYAHFHRNHKNKVEKGDPFYGAIKKAAYNEPMARVELLVGLFKTKEAAEKAGGFVADKELNKLAKDEDLPVSMACSIDYDQCSYCGNKATHRDHYCTDKTCKAGGCTDNLARVIKMGGDLHHLHVDNPHPRWFDLSGVHRPADRTAYATRADYFTKAAADGFDGAWPRGGAALAEELGLTPPLAVLLDCGPLGVTDRAVEEGLKLAHALDALERAPALHALGGHRLAFAPAVRRPLPIEGLGGRDREVKLAALAEERVVLSLGEFASLEGKGELVGSARSLLAGAYGRMLADGSLVGRLKEGAVIKTAAVTERARKWAQEIAPGRSLAVDDVRSRAILAAALSAAPPRPVFGKAADGAEVLARDYACYKLAALRRVAATGDDLAPVAALAREQDAAL